MSYLILLKCNLHGEIAQLARALGSYPKGRGFDSLSRYQYEDKDLLRVFFYSKILLVLPHSQAVRQWTLTPLRVSSNLTGAAIFFDKKNKLCIIHLTGSFYYEK